MSLCAFWWKQHNNCRREDLEILEMISTYYMQGIRLIFHHWEFLAINKEQRIYQHQSLHTNLFPFFHIYLYIFLCKILCHKNQWFFLGGVGGSFFNITKLTSFYCVLSKFSYKVVFILILATLSAARIFCGNIYL